MEPDATRQKDMCVFPERAIELDRSTPISCAKPDELCVVGGIVVENLDSLEDERGNYFALFLNGGRAVDPGRYYNPYIRLRYSGRD
jgi:hypothetical protein